MPPPPHHQIQSQILHVNLDAPWYDEVHSPASALSMEDKISINFL